LREAEGIGPDALDMAGYEAGRPFACGSRS
jgi:hypothetical protein